MSRIHDTNLLINHDVHKLVAIECDGCHHRERPGSAKLADWFMYGCRDVTIGQLHYDAQIFEWDYCENCKNTLTGALPVGKKTWVL
jgi:hypothetical protein